MAEGGFTPEALTQPINKPTGERAGKIRGLVNKFFHRDPKENPNPLPVPPPTPEIPQPLPETAKPLPVETPTSELSQPAPTFIGLERLDELREDEPLLEGFAEHGTTEGKERAKARLEAIRTERAAIFEKFGLTQDLEEYTKKHHVTPDDAKTISRILIERAAKALPPVQAGYIRMYRGEGSHPGETEDYTVGRWFAHNLLISSSFPAGPLGDGHTMYIDIPENSLGQYHVQNMPSFKGASKGGEYLLPKEVVTQAKELVRFLKATTKTDPWAKGPSSV